MINAGAERDAEEAEDTENGEDGGSRKGVKEEGELSTKSPDPLKSNFAAPNDSGSTHAPHDTPQVPHDTPYGVTPAPHATPSFEALHHRGSSSSSGFGSRNTDPASYSIGPTGAQQGYQTGTKRECALLSFRDF